MFSATGYTWFYGLDRGVARLFRPLATSSLHEASLAKFARICQKLDLQPVHLEDLTSHYPRTLANWRQRFVSQRDTLRARGFSDRFLRTWEFYFCYCEGGFRERAIGNVQLMPAKPDCRRLPPFPSLSAAPS